MFIPTTTNKRQTPNSYTICKKTQTSLKTLRPIPTTNIC
jgi:hypothetical protein